MKLALKLVMGIKFSSIGLFFLGIILSGKTSWGEEVSAIPHVPSGGSAISSVDTDPATVAAADSAKEADKGINKEETKADKKEIVEDETIIEAWARILSQNVRKCFNENTAMGLLAESAKGILFVVPETLGTLLGVHAGSVLGFYRKSDGHWGLPIIYQVESETPIKWEETKLLVILIRNEKAQVSMLTSQWSYYLEPAHKDISLMISGAGKISFWSPESKDFHKEMKLSFHFNREINEELYGIKNIRAIDIVFDSSEAPLCLRALRDCLESRK